MSTTLKFCAECGAPLDKNDRFCPVCGGKVIEDDEQNHEKSPAKNASSSPPPNKSRPKVAPYVSTSSKESSLSPTEEIQTPPYARFSYRIGAMIIDWSLIALIVLGGFYILVIIDEFIYRISDDDVPLMFLMLTAVSIVTAWYYNAGMEASKFQTTFGKYLFGLKVTNSKGNQCTIKCTSIRFIGKLISLPLYGAGYLLIAFTERKQALHDKLANTLVIEGEIKVKFMKKLCQIYEKMIIGETK